MLSAEKSTRIGIDIGQKRDPSAVCVAELEPRAVGRRVETHYLVRHLERLPLGTPYPEVAQRIDAVVSAVQSRSGAPPTVLVDGTGVGQPVVDLLQAQRAWGRSLVAVTFTAGRKWKLRRGVPLRLSLGKESLASRLQALLQGGRIHLPGTREGKALAAELMGYEIRVDEGGHARFGAFRSGTHDDLVTALGLVVGGRQGV